MRGLLCTVTDASTSLEGHLIFDQQWRDDELRWIKQAEAMQIILTATGMVAWRRLITLVVLFMWKFPPRLRRRMLH
jgi:hypothetical protein